MRKGKFGIVLCFYPIAAFIAVILNSPLICAALAVAAIFLEKDEWTGRQTLQAWMASVLVFFFDHVLSWAVDLVYVPYLSGFLSVVTTVLFVLVYLVVILFSVLGIIRVRKDGEANLPLLSELAYHVYGQQKPKPAPSLVQQYPMPYGVPQQPQQAPQAQQQPYPPQPYAAPQYTPPTPAQTIQPQEVQPANIQPTQDSNQD